MAELAQIEKSVSNLSDNLSLNNLDEVIANAKDVLMLACMAKRKQPIAPRSETMGMREISIFRNRIAQAVKSKNISNMQRVADDLLTAYPQDPQAAMMHQDLQLWIDEL
ncbi:hypothetical protein MX630_04960 [Carnobacterium divergens]|uniref:hypothetical protein n=1 Tax=Carnobacterium divergens TaxID=2748 RepID=UPI00288E007E|nr:hypothetical protein [Carnobacterium divergens]MDT1950092.1 hypothetical protein [Carnobacterium divergens]MDT1955270.1 hypothetical protein [Carnobacterium divergens]MDT1960508.1 hypothetical protein [Carnobacterium divergens]MDT1963052.1 hypothetical protein [Carnobacterium divergens]